MRNYRVFFETDLFGEVLKLSSTLRADKNENFDLNVSPAASLVYTPTEKNIIRLSFSSAIRNPTLADQYLYYNTGRAILIGNLIYRIPMSKVLNYTMKTFLYSQHN